ncbi:hypothetical protein H0X48_03285 [Candidatus Dependentiae bacterium]|nr:hypothetical protein [Candidatus Dependentiae bacterium]
MFRTLKLTLIFFSSVLYTFSLFGCLRYIPEYTPNRRITKAVSPVSLRDLAISKSIEVLLSQTHQELEDSLASLPEGIKDILKSALLQKGNGLMMQKSVGVLVSGDAKELSLEELLAIIQVKRP